MKNNKNAIKVREKKLKNGYSSLYFDIYHNGKREYDFLKMYIKNNPKTQAEKQKNQEVIELVEKIRAAKESQLKHSEHGYISPKLRKMNFLDYCDAYVLKYPNTDMRIVKYCIKHFKDFIINIKGYKQIMPNELTEQLVSEFKKHLDKKFNGETPYNFFTKFKKLCRDAYKEKILTSNPAENVINKRKEGLKKDILFIDEIQRLADAKCPNPEVRRAFLFCLNTGLRYVDVSGLTWGQVYDEYILIKSQKKTGEAVSIDLNFNALQLLGKEFGDREEKVFKLPTLESCLKSLKVWTNNAGINKNITWHSSRHSFAVGLLSNNTDVKTVGSLLGHSGLKHVDKYTRVVSSLKKEAVNKFPVIKI